MKDYSKLIQSSYGYITKYEIVGNEIHVYTAESEKGEPHKYPANKEWINSIERRLENQYKTVVDNKEVFKKEFVEKGSKKLNLATIVISAALLTASGILFLLELGLVSIPVMVSLIMVIGGNRAIVLKRGQDFDKEVEVIEAYLKNRKLIDTASRVDNNVISYLSSDTTKRIKENRELEARQIIDSTFNIDFMDKTSLKDLKKMLNRYYISNALEEEQTFVSPLDDGKKKDAVKARNLKKRK